MNRRTFIKTTGIASASCGTLASTAAGRRTESNTDLTATEVTDVASDAEDHDHAYYVNVTTW